MTPGLDMAREQLEQYRPQPHAPADLDAFWSATIDAALAQPLGIELRAYDLDLAGVVTTKVSFAGFEAGTISGWYLRPDRAGVHPGLVVYHGYSGRAPRPLELYAIAAQGIAVLAVDCRGQNGDSSDEVARPSGHVAGWMTHGIRDPERYYYRHVYADAVRALEVLCSFAEVDGSRIATTGISQGGGLSLAAAALSARPSFVWSDIAYLCDIRRGVALAALPPYTEISDFIRSHPALEAQVWRTLSYVDMLNLAQRITCPAVLTVGLWDEICPPSTVYAVFHRIASTEKVLKVLPYHRHELSYEIAEERLTALVRALAARG